VHHPRWSTCTVSNTETMGCPLRRSNQGSRTPTGCCELSKMCQQRAAVQGDLRPSSSEESFRGLCGNGCSRELLMQAAQVLMVRRVESPPVATAAAAVSSPPHPFATVHPNHHPHHHHHRHRHCNDADLSHANTAVQPRTPDRRRPAPVQVDQPHTTAQVRPPQLMISPPSPVPAHENAAPPRSAHPDLKDHVEYLQLPAQLHPRPGPQPSSTLEPKEWPSRVDNARATSLCSVSMPRLPSAFDHRHSIVPVKTTNVCSAVFQWPVLCDVCTCHAETERQREGGREKERERRRALMRCPCSAQCPHATPRPAA